MLLIVFIYGMGLFFAFCIVLFLIKMVFKLLSLPFILIRNLGGRDGVEDAGVSLVRGQIHCFFVGGNW